MDSQSETMNTRSIRNDIWAHNERDYVHTTDAQSGENSLYILPPELLRILGETIKNVSDIKTIDKMWNRIMSACELLKFALQTGKLPLGCVVTKYKIGLTVLRADCDDYDIQLPRSTIRNMITVALKGLCDSLHFCYSEISTPSYMFGIALRSSHQFTLPVGNPLGSRPFQIGRCYWLNGVTGTSYVDTFSKYVK